MNKFKTDLQQGELGEKVIAEFLQTKGYTIMEYNKTMSYDLKVERGGNTTTIEIKTDRWEYFKDNITNNMFIEVECSGKPSGVMGTNADYFIYYYPDFEIMYLISVNDIRKLIKEVGVLRTMSGDGGRVTGYLINRRIHKDKFLTYKIKKTDVWS
jgi:hypothetical protein